MEEEEKKIQTAESPQSGSISRRKFLKDAGLIVGGATVGSMAILSACSGDPVTTTLTKTSTVTGAAGTSTVTTTVTAGAGSTVTVTQPPITQVVQIATDIPVIKLTVNGEAHELRVEPEETLRKVLREQLGLISIKDMCVEYGACGSCTVIMDGRPILSCMTLACECDGAVIETAEGIARAKHPLIETYVANYCMQCGYCTPGFVATSKALLDKNPNPTEEDIREALAGNLCRCATYTQHIPAVQQAAAALKGGN
jgi:aerobic-type carbon monoxide dehydrogenase small subunit (CoxS/CutS family)